MVLSIALGQFQNVQRTKGSVDPISRTIRSAISPASNGLVAVGNQVNRFSTGIFKAASLAKENENLKALAQSAQFYTEQTDRQRREINELRLLTNLGPLLGHERVSADIIGFFPRENRITLSAGENQGIKKGMPVESGRGLVAVVETVEPTRCQALLITSRNQTVGGLVMSRDPAQLGFMRGQDGTSVILSLQDPKSPVEVGDTVVTSGFGERIPRGMIVGKIVQVIPSEEFGTVRAIIDPIVSLGTIREVHVLK